MEAKIAKEVRQGCNLFYTSFNLYIEETIKEVKEKKIGGLKIGGMPINMLLFADKTTKIAENEKSLTNMLK